jgi:glycosyl hydrolase family 99
VRKKSSLAARRQFLGTGLAAAAGLLLPGSAAASPSAGLQGLRARFPDLRRRFIFEYYPWYGRDPWRHWDAEDRTPPHDVAAPYMPQLGAYDSRSRAVIEQHARWIADSGVGAVNLSWWGPGSYEDRAAHGVMDVMRDHDLKVTFHIEPYAVDRGRRFATDVLYLLEEYGERRHFDAFLLLQDPDGSVSPLFKGFEMILPPTFRDCRGIERPVADYTPDREWQQQLGALRSVLRGDFERVRVLADSLGVDRVAASGFDGIAVYDNRVGPERYAAAARAASDNGLLFSFNVNPGFHLVRPRVPVVDECGQAVPHPPFLPPGKGLDLTTPLGRERAAQLSSRRIIDSFAATVALQTDPALLNAQRDFFVTYVNSFNEWHEGHAFEPMRDAAALTPEELAWGYDNPQRGDYRLALLKELVRGVLSGAERLSVASAHR